MTSGHLRPTLRSSHPPPTSLHPFLHFNFHSNGVSPAQASPPMPTLLSLHDAVLLRVWEHLLGDLPTHVALAQTSRRLRAVYCKSDEAWQAACFSAGFGRPLRRLTGAIDLSWSWRWLACVLVKHSRICEIGSCIRANACFGEFSFNL